VRGGNIPEEEELILPGFTKVSCNLFKTRDEIVAKKGQMMRRK
jgi:hypothetical protein